FGLARPLRKDGGCFSRTCARACRSFGKRRAAKATETIIEDGYWFDLDSIFQLRLGSRACWRRSSSCLSALQRGEENTMCLIELLSQGRALAERIPYSAVALLSRVAVASVFWRSGQTKVSGFHIREETFVLFREEYKVPLLPPDLAAYMSTVAEHVFPVLLVIGFFPPPPP